MSGTSLDGVDAALLRTDGETKVEPGSWLTLPYPDTLRNRLRAILGGRGAIDEVEHDITQVHATAVERLLAKAGCKADQIDLIGMHGHTILHQPDAKRTWQIGDAALLAARTGIDVIADFRGRDVAEGGEGAPLAPIYHAAIATGLARPVAVLNIGGVGNVTWIGENGDLLAFDTGPGNGLIDDWALLHTGRPVDWNGALADAGRVDRATVDRFLGTAYFKRRPPKSLDRLDFETGPLDGLSPADGAATLTAITAEAIALAARFFPAPVKHWLVTGGGRHNPVLMRALAGAVDGAIKPVDAVGFEGDALEAQAFAYLAVRSQAGLPISFPTTTGIRRPLAGGTLHPAP
jgi:anhydro-N-acetylmuramic acid kinase